MKWSASHPPGFVARVLLIAVVYFASAKLGLALAYAQGNVTAVWPPTGLALAALVIWGYRFWPGVALGALLANATTDVPALTTLGITVGNTLEALAGAALLSRFDFRPSLARVRDVLALVLCAAVLSTTVSATIGNTSLLLGGEIDSERLAFFWRLWWLGDMGGDLLVAPVLMVLVSHPAWPELTRRRVVEAAVLVSVVVVVSVLALSPETPLAFLAFPGLVVATLRFRQIGAAVASLVVAFVAVWITARGGGPFAGGGQDENLLESQLFCGVGALTALLLAAILTERKRVEDTQRFLAETSKLLVASLELDRTLDAVAHAAVPDLADWCMVYILDEADALQPVAIACADPSRETLLWELARRDPDPDAPSAIAKAVRTGRSELLEDAAVSLLPTAAGGEHHELVRELRFRSAVILPLLARGRTLGGLALVSTESTQRFEEADLRVAEDLANRCALAADNARLYRHEHSVAETLQRSLLPDRLPDIAGVEFAARYLPGSAGVDIGGDWYDAIQNPDGALILVIGDVAGRGIRAASTMGQLRTAARAYALEGRSPATILAALNRLAHAAEFRDMATVLCVAYDPATGGLRISRAGHLPPLVISPRGDVRTLEGAASLPLNVEASARFTEAEEHLEPRSTLLLYTDGLVERKHKTLSEGLRDLELAAARAPKGVDALCDYIAEHVLGDAERPDDVALLAFQALPLHGEGLQLRLPARPEVLADLRRSLRRWLDRAGATEEETFSITLAAGEACANSIEHAHGPADAELEIVAVLDDGVVKLTVHDFGRWRSPRGEHRGRGLQLMSLMMDDVAVSHDDDGTAVHMSRRLVTAADGQPSQPAVTKSPRRPAKPSRNAVNDAFAGPAALRLSRDDDVVIAALVGEIDMANAQDIFGRIAAALDNRALGLILDLSATEYLDSSGLQALLELGQRTRVRGQKFRVVAPFDSAPRQLMELVHAQDSVPLHVALPEALTAFRGA
jgi:anti-anti-sigma factor